MKARNLSITLFHLARNMLARLGVFVSASVPANTLRSTLKQIQPRETGHSLIRVGSHNDGGYLVPDDNLGNLGGVISPGVDTNCSFELFFANRGVPCLLIDASVDGPPIQHDMFKFLKLWLAGYGKKGLSLSLRDAILEFEAGRDLLLQMDIEGSEFEALICSSTSDLERFRIIVLELHSFASIISPSGLYLFSSLFLKLLHTHAVAHIHGNNNSRAIRFKGLNIPNQLEITLLRKDRLSGGKRNLTIPHVLDEPNNPKKGDPPINWFH